MDARHEDRQIDLTTYFYNNLVGILIGGSEANIAAGIRSREQMREFVHSQRSKTQSYHSHMGRYYSGDIEGKFWFAVQISEDASFFGGDMSEPNYLEYYFTEDDKEDIEIWHSKVQKGTRRL